MQHSQVRYDDRTLKDEGSETLLIELPELGNRVLKIAAMTTEEVLDRSNNLNATL